MATVVKRGSGTPATTGTTWASATLAVDGTAGTNGVTYATMTNATASAVATIEITGYDFASSIASVDTLNSVSVALRHFENNTGRFASVTFQAFDGATSIGTATTCTLATGARTDTATPAVTLAQLRSSTFKIRCTITGAASTQSRVFSLDQIDVTADYTPLPPTITQAAYRIYDDGTETGAVALAAQDTAANGDITSGDGIGQLRVRLQSTNAAPPTASDDWQLQWEKNTSGTWADVIGTSAETLANSYSETNVDVDSSFQTDSIARGQSFLGNGQVLSKAGFWIKRLGSPTGNLTARLYAHTGTFGSAGTGTGSVLVTSTTTITTASVGTTYAWSDFVFPETFTLVNATPYVVMLAMSAFPPDLSNTMIMGGDVSTPTHAGNNVNLYSPSTWSGGSVDIAFRVYTKVLGTTAVPYASANLTDAAATTNRLGAGSGSFVAGKISETGLVTDLGWSANNYTELLYSVAIKKPDVTAGDVIRFRVLRNGATTGMTYTAVPTVNVVQGGGGPATTTSNWGTWTATAVGVDERVATITTGWGAVAHTATGIIEHPATVTTAWGALAATAIGTVSTAATDWPGTITTGWGAATATATATVEHPATVTSGWGAWAATAVAIEEHPATIAVSWVGWSATAAATFEHPVNVASAWGALTATAVGTVTTGPVNYPGTITSGWGAWVATASPAVVEHPATALGSWGVLAASGVAVVAHPATVTTGWGGLTATAVAVVDHPATISSLGPGWYSQATATQEGFEFGFIDSNWGGLTATANAQPFNRNATVSSNWGQLTATATATTNHPATITTGWGALTTPATATVSRRATATGSWSLRVADSSADVDRHATITTTWACTFTAIGAPSKGASSSATWGPSTFTATATVERRATTSSTTTWTATATADGAHYATSTTTWGPFTALATSTVTEHATITSNWGTWDARAYQEGVLAAHIDSTWGPLTATAVGVHLAVWGQWNGHAVVDIWWGDQDASDYLMLV